MAANKPTPSPASSPTDGCPASMPPTAPATSPKAMKMPPPRCGGRETGEPGDAMPSPLHQSDGQRQRRVRLALSCPSGKPCLVHRFLPLLLAAAAGTAQAQTAPAGPPPPAPTAEPVAPAVTVDIPGPQAPLPDLPGGEALAWPDVVSTSSGDADAPDAAVCTRATASARGACALRCLAHPVNPVWCIGSCPSCSPLRPEPRRPKLRPLGRRRQHQPPSLSLLL